MQKQYGLFAGISLAMMVIFVPPAFAQYDVLDKGVYQEMANSKSKVDIATHPDALGSGTPVFGADGIFGASLFSAAVFGGISAMFFIKGRKGKYAAMGRG